MKKVENKQVVVGTDHEGKEQHQSTAGLARACLYAMPQGGFTIEIQKRRIRVLDQIEVAEKNKSNQIELEDADHDTLVECVKTMSWGILSKGIVEFSAQFGV